jgi:selenocysteine lyase/cysteine desulfurase
MKNDLKQYFKIPDHITYLNGAYMSPLLKSIEKIGHDSVSKKCLPYEISASDFFEDSIRLKKEFAKLVKIKDINNIAIIPSVSYGVSTVCNNIRVNQNEEILIVGEQFPSNFYAWKKLADKNKAVLRIVSAPVSFVERGKNWNQLILKAINKKTTVVAIGNIHWADGTLFDLPAIRLKTKENNALFVIDGTQSIGALPFSVNELDPDALICAGYKWLLGPYSTGIAYYSDFFNEGNPIEENWINRRNSEDFSGLVNYEKNYQPKAGRYNVGEMSNFTLLPMLIKAIEQLNEWGVESIQKHCEKISKKAINELRNLDCFVENDLYRAHHLFGVYLPQNISLNKLRDEFSKKNIFVSLRGNAIRVSPNIYNDENDFDKLVSCFKTVI